MIEADKVTLSYYLVVTGVCWVVAAYVVLIRIRAPAYHFGVILLIYHLIGFVYRPALLLLGAQPDIWAWTGNHPDSATMFRATIIINSAFLSCIAGIAFGRGTRQIQPFPRLELDAIATRTWLFLFCAFLLAGLAASSVTSGDFAHKLAGGEARGVVDDQGGRRSETSGYIALLGDSLALLIVLGCAVRQTRRFAIVLAIAFVLYRAAIGGGRSIFVAVALGLVVVFMVRQHLRHIRPRFLALLFLVLVLFDVLGSNRQTVLSLVSGTASVAEVVERYSEARGSAGFSSDFAEFDVATSLLHIVPDRTGWTFGTQYIRLLIWPIPRQWWPDKPVFTSSVNLQNYGNFYPLTLTLYVDTYMTGGLFLMCLLLFCIGLLFSRFYKMVASRQSTFLFAAYLSAFSFLPNLLRDGPVPFIYFFLVSFVPLSVLLKLGRVQLVTPRGK